LKTNTGSLASKPNAPLPTASLPYNPQPLGSDTQKQFASMMDQVLTQEGPKAKHTPKQKGRRSRLIWVLVVAAILVLLLLLAVFGFKLIPLPQLFSAETVTFYNTVETLPENAPVLIAMDYSPSFTAELQPISQTLLTQLVAKDARVSFISTEPTGPFFADQLLQSITQKVPSYNLAEKTANLGYLAGGAAGLQGFALHPTIAIQQGWDGGDVWSSPALAGVNDLSKFAMIVVLSDNADSAREWIEQVQPHLGAVPLLIASSSQNGPLLQPYTASHQVKGLVSGIPGWASYENILGKGGENAGLWSLYLVGQIIAILLIIVGVILRFTSENRVRDRKEK